MRNILLSVSVLIMMLFVSASAANAQTKPAVTEDTQIWSDVQIFFALNRKTDVFATGTFRLGRNLTHPIDERIGGGFVFKPNKFFAVSPAYLHLAQQPLKNIKRYENRLNLAVTLFYPFEKYLLSDRNQVERRFLSRRPDTWRYRNRLQIERTFNLGKLNFNGYLSDEVFYDSGSKGWTRNRFLAGFTHKFSPRYALDVYSGRQNDGRTKPGNWNIIGATLKIRFNSP